MGEEPPNLDISSCNEQIVCDSGIYLIVCRDGWSWIAWARTGGRGLQAEGFRSSERPGRDDQTRQRAERANPGGRAGIGQSWVSGWTAEQKTL